MQVAQFISVLVLFTVLSLCNARHTSRPEWTENCEDCPSVVYKPLRKPGHICGGPSDSWGICEKGLQCICNRCTGCSLRNLECYVNNECMPYESIILA